MAKMVPPYLTEDTRSLGERTLFHKFKEDPDTDGWIVLHSLDVANHKKRLSGELDFIVIIPGQGVLFLEVKASNDVVRQDGCWVYGRGENAKKSNVGPFRQASDAMHSIRDYLARQDRSLSRLLYFSGVFFTGSVFNKKSPEWHQWQFTDKNTIGRMPISKICLQILKNAHEHIGSSTSSRWYSEIDSRPSKEQSIRILEILRGDFEYYKSPSSVVENIEEEIKLFTKEQFGALDLLRENKRIIYKGPAGTGKTLLAIEATSRSLSEGRRTLTVCYNRLLGDWLVKEMDSSKVKDKKILTIGTLHSVLLSLSGLQPPKNYDANFWSEKLPDTVLDRILCGIVRAPLFDTLIIDEAQDLLSEKYLEVFDFLLYGGIAGGNWAMFGDFERQAIYSIESSHPKTDIENLVLNRAPHSFKYPLRVNCRNDESIALGTELVCFMKPGYDAYLKSSGKSQIETYFYNNNEEQTSLLLSHLDRMKNYFKANQIIVLSSKKDDDCASFSLLQKHEKTDLVQERSRKNSDDKTGYCSIYAYKGMESPVVILTDINKINGSQAEALLYIGMTRAKAKLVILMRKSCKNDWSHAIQEGF
jgi:hypothetical protein